MFVVKKKFCREKNMFVAKKMLSCKTFVLTNICRDKHNFVFVATKMILLGAPASDRVGVGSGVHDRLSECLLATDPTALMLINSTGP